MLECDSQIRERAVWALMEMNEKFASPPITKLLEDPDPRVRGRAAYALAKLDGTSAPKINKLLDDEDSEVRGYAMLALGTLKEKTAVRRIAESLKDPEPWIQTSAAEALSLLSGEKWTGDTVEAASDWWELHKNDPEYFPPKK